jgi:hypothetical protein
MIQQNGTWIAVRYRASAPLFDGHDATQEAQQNSAGLGAFVSLWSVSDPE